MLKPLKVCQKCNQIKGRYAHVCPPEWVMRLKLAQRRALEIAARRYDPPTIIKRLGRGNVPPPIDLPAPASGWQFSVLGASAPAPVAEPPVPTVCLLPTLLLGGVSSQKELEPLTTATRKVRASRFKWIDGCPPSNCGAADIASYLCHLPWSYSAVLRDRPEAVLDSLMYFSETGLAALDALVSSPPKLTDPFYVFSLTSPVNPKDFNPRRPRGLHVHLCVGNLTWPEFNALLSAWPGYVSSKGKQSMKGNEWQAIHYAMAQDAETGDPLIDDYLPAKKRLALQHIADWGRGQGHLFPPVFSPGLDDLGPFNNPTPGIVSRFHSRRPWVIKQKRIMSKRRIAALGILSSLSFPEQVYPGLAPWLLYQLQPRRTS
jgi:hypothetical protein